MNIEPVTLEGKWVRVEPLELHHTEALFHAGQDPAIWSYMPTKVTSLHDMDTVVKNAVTQREKGGQFPFVVLNRLTGNVVGSTRFLEISPQDRNLEIGWTWYSPTVWRTGINTETKYLLLKHCFETIQTIRVQFKTHHLNSRSQEAIERIGGVKEGILRNHRIVADGSIRHSVYYSILDSEWPEVKMRFEQDLLK